MESEEFDQLVFHRRIGVGDFGKNRVVDLATNTTHQESVIGVAIPVDTAKKVVVLKYFARHD
jgi:hypothetical protein